MSAPTDRRVDIPTKAADLTAAWVSEALGLGAAERVTAIPVGTGNAASTLRLSIDWAEPGSGPATLIAKVSAPEPEKRAAAMAWRAYEVEVAFYSSLAGELEADIPRCFWTGFDAGTGDYTVLLEDLAGLTPGDDVAGSDPDTADRALAQLALVHGPRWNDPVLESMAWLNRYPTGQGGILRPEMTAASERVASTYVEDLPAELIDVICRFAATSNSYDRKGFGQPRTITHSDLRNDNMMFGPDRVCILDWQTVQLGAALADVAYYLATALAVEERRSHERDLVRSYYGRLRAQGVDLTWDTCWREYRRHGLALLTTALKVVAQRSDLAAEGRLRDLTLALVGRGAQQALDLGSVELLGC